MPPLWPTPDDLYGALLAVLQRTDLTTAEDRAAALRDELIARNWIKLAGQAPRVALGGILTPTLLPGAVVDRELALAGDAALGHLMVGGAGLLGQTTAEYRYSTPTTYGVRITNTGLSTLLAGAGAVFGAVIRES